MTSTACYALRVRRASLPLLFLVSLAGGACAPEQAFVALPPLDSEVRSWIVARGEGPTLRIIAGDAEHAATFAALDAPAPLELAAFDVSLGTLGLAPGAYVPPTTARTATLPTAHAVYASEVDEGEATAWTSIAAPALLADVRVPAPDPCARFSAEVRSLPRDSDVDWGLSVDPDTALLGGPLETTLVVLRTDESPRLMTLTASTGTTTPVAPRSAFLDRRGRLWMGDEDGGLWVGTLPAALDHAVFEHRVRRSPHGTIVALTGDPDDPERELLAMTSRARVLQLNGRGWRVLDRFEEVPGSDENHGVAWVAPGRAFASAASWPEVHALRDGVVEPVMVNDGEVGVGALAALGDGRVAAGMSTGLVALYEDGTWRRLGRGALALDLHAFLRWRGGFVYAGAFGYVGQWHPDTSFCPVSSEAALASASVRALLPLGDTIVAVGDAPRGMGAATYTTLRP